MVANKPFGFLVGHHVAIDITLYTGEETKGGRKRKKTSLKIIIVVK